MLKRTLIVPLVTLALATAACGSGGNSSSGASDSATSGGITSTAPAPTGSPIVLGMINDLTGPIGAFPQIFASADAAVAHINKDLGGAGGHPLKLIHCETAGTPESASNCANQLVADKVTAVVNGVHLGADQVMQILSNAGIPIIGGVGLTPPELTSTDAFFFWGSGPAGFGTMAAFAAQNLKAKSVGIVGGSDPIGSSLVDNQVIPVLKAKGVTTIARANVAPTETDFSAATEKAIADKPDVLLVFLPDIGCTGVMKALASLGSTIPAIYNYSCANPTVFQGAPASSLNGAYFDSPTIPYTNTANPDVAEYASAIKKYGDKDAHVDDFFSQSTFQSFMDLRALIEGLGSTPPTSAALLAAVKATKDEKNFMGSPYTCDGKQIPGIVAACSGKEYMTQWKDGTLKQVGDSAIEPF